MLVEEFENLKEGDPVHTQSHEYTFLSANKRWVLVDYIDENDRIKEEYSKEYFLKHFTLGRHPSNLPQPSEQELFVNVYECQDGKFEGGTQTYKSSEQAYRMRADNHTYRYTAKLVRVEIQTPYVPKHDERCRFEHQSGNIINCKAIHSEGQVCAVGIEKCALGYMFYNPDKIKRFLPLT